MDVVTPSELHIAKFLSWDKSKSSAPRLRSFNRARKWVSNLLKRPFNVSDAHKLRNIDSMMALQHMIDSMAMPGGISYEDYLRKCMAILPIQKEIDLNNESDKVEANEATDDENFQDAIQDDSNSKADLKTHIESVHEGKKSYQCSLCDGNFFFI